MTPAYNLYTPMPEGAFWHRLLEGNFHRSPTHHVIRPPGLPVILVQSQPGQMAPNMSRQMHLDSAVEASRKQTAP
ncbi:hypothetical protein ACIQVR_31625 [Streptomyces xanthochromogenes]|uniref:hypothetical protein n=1 Tax=Streptomyces xanthochromogenes TaxID=67384 RepID=UPI003818F7DC